MKITFLGGADEVGASSILVETAGRRVLVDCGIRPSPRAHAGLEADQLPHLSQLESGSGKLDAVLVTHSHTDHTGALELVLERYPDVPVYATAPTLALTRVLHQDSRRIMQNRLDEEGELPLFDDVAVQRLMSSMIPVPFKTRLPLAEGLAVTFFPAGHIAGAAMIGLESDDGRLLISGDVSISPQRTVDGARPPAFQPDAFIVESTYGGRLHANRAVQERKLVETVARVTAGGGKVLIPAFALGRAQEILLILDEYQRRGELPAIPVWADGMVRTICQAYPSFGEALPLALQERLGSKTGEPKALANSLFFNERIRPVASSDQRNAILWEPGPEVIVASSGMLAGGPSLSYARALASRPEHAILLTGYQDEESPGRRLQELGERGSGTIRLGTDKVDVQCLVTTYSLSAHADQSQLINLAETLGPEHVFLVHGDAEARASLETALAARQHIVHTPRAGESFELKFERRGRFIRPDRSTDPRPWQSELNQQRREAMSQFAGAAGKWLIVKGQGAAPIRCLSVESDHLWVESAPGLEHSVHPEEVLTVLGTEPPAPEELAPFTPESVAPAIMEPNQALAAANTHFPPEARLRKSGYHLAEHILALTFDFPDTARDRYAHLIASLGQLTGWQVEVTSETNHSALNSLVREVLPQGWQVVKGPAIHRDQKQVVVAVQAPEPISETSQEICDRFRVISYWELSLAESVRPVSAPVAFTPAGARMEINAAYSLIKSVLEGSTLYRTSLKGEEIVLSFISPQVGSRYQEKITELAMQTGWPLSISPQPNQGAILETVRAMIAREGFNIAKGPSIYLERSEVSVVLMASPAPEQLAALASAFEETTGFRLAATVPAVKAESAPRPAPANSMEAPLNRIRLSQYQQSLSLDPVRLEKNIERARIMGITPPVRLKRTRDGYLLVDGLYRLRAAEALGLERIPAVVE